jgi:hypothetical protein
VGVGLTNSDRTFTEFADAKGTLFSTPTLCGARTYSILDSSNNAVSWASISGSGPYTITFSPNIDNLYSSSPHSLKLHIVLASYTSITANIPITVNVSRYTCTGSTSYTASGTVNASYSYIIGDTALSVTAPAYTTSPYTCAETVTYALKAEDTPGSGTFTTTPPAHVTFNSSTRVAQVVTTNTANAATLKLRFIVTRSQGTSPVNIDFEVVLSNSCSATTITTTGITFTDVTVGVGLTNSDRTFTEFADAKGTLYSTAGLCGARTYSILDSSNNAVSWASVTGSGPYTINFSPNADNLYTSSPFSLKLHIVLASYTSITANVAITVNVNRYLCTTSTNYSGSPAISATHSYTIGDAALTITAPTYTTSPYTCAETIAYTLTKQDGSAAPAYATISNKVVTIVTTDASKAGTVSLRVTATGSQSNKALNSDFTVTLSNTCSATTITTTGVTLSDVSVGIGLTATRTFTEFADSKGTLYSTPTLCGAR